MDESNCWVMFLAAVAVVVPAVYAGVFCIV
jgi:hypothetical protein